MSRTCYRSACSSTHAMSGVVDGRKDFGRIDYSPAKGRGSLCVIVILISFAPIAALSAFHESHEGHGLVWTRL